MRFANPAEATEALWARGLVPSGCARGVWGSLGVHGWPWGFLGVHGGSLGFLGRAFEGLGGSSGRPWVLSGGSFKLLGRSLGVLGSLRELIEGPWRVLGELLGCPR